MLLLADIDDATLTAKVIAVNKANAKANDLYDTLTNIFSPLVGKRVVKFDGTLIRSVEKLIPKPLDGDGIYVSNNSGGVRLEWRVQASEQIEGKGYAVYHRAKVLVGWLRHDTLDSISLPNKLRTDYTVEEVQDKLKAYLADKIIADTRLEALKPFKSFDCTKNTGGKNNAKRFCRNPRKTPRTGKKDRRTRLLRYLRRLHRTREISEPLNAGSRSL